MTTDNESGSIGRALSFEPGSQFEYNNANYNMLAWVIENIVGTNCGDALKKNS